MEEEGILVVRVLHRREAYRKSALARQDILDVDSSDETGDRERLEHPGGGSELEKSLNGPCLNIPRTDRTVVTDSAGRAAETLRSV